MRCVICDSNDWENVDKFRLKPKAKMKPVGMSVCKTCGFVSYPEKWKSPEEIREHYRKSYRPGPRAQNLFTGTRKIHYHNFFLHKILKAWKDTGIKPDIFEVGAAYGLVLKWISDELGGNCNVVGSELTTTYRRVAKNELGIRLDEDFDDSRKYDLIISYKVAEHQLDVDLELKKYAACLKEDGILYISVPTWFRSMTCFGLSGFDLEYYYDPNHVNVWTREMFKYLLYKCGLTVVSEDHVVYDSTYLCRARKPEDVVPEFEVQGPDNIKKMMGAIRAAYQAFADNDFDRALDTFQNYPSAWVNRAEYTRQKLFTRESGAPYDVRDEAQRQELYQRLNELLFKPAIAACPGSAEVQVMCADFSMRARCFPEAVKFIEDGIKMSPENPVMLNQMANCMKELGIRATEPAERLHYFRNGLEVARHLRATSPSHLKEATDLIYMFAAEIPLEGEGPTLTVNKVPEFAK